MLDIVICWRIIVNARYRPALDTVTSTGLVRTSHLFERSQRSISALRWRFVRDMFWRGQ
jgi:hypothetical protein